MLGVFVENDRPLLVEESGSMDVDAKMRKP